MKIGYARVSTTDQTPALQLDALKRAGCKKIFTEEGRSGADTGRPTLRKALKQLERGDVLVIWRLDRLGRSLPHLIQIATDLAARGISLKSLTEEIDTSSAGGKLVFHVFGALAEFERSLIIERTRAGLTAAKRRGAKLGRRPKLTPSQIDHARKLRAAGESGNMIADTLNISPATLYRHLGKAA